MVESRECLVHSKSADWNCGKLIGYQYVCYPGKMMIFTYQEPSNLYHSLVVILYLVADINDRFMFTLVMSAGAGLD